MSQSMKRRNPTSLIDLCYSGKGPERPGSKYYFSPAPANQAAADGEEELLFGPDEVDTCRCSANTGKRGPLKALVLERLPTGGAEDDSLPSSPHDSPTECGQMREFPGDGSLEQETHELMQNFLMLYAGTCSRSPVRTKALCTMRRVVDDVLVRHRFAYRGMITKLKLDQESDDMSVIRVVAENIFNDGMTNWGRIASLVAFGAEVSKCLKKNGREHCIRAVAQQIAIYLLSEQRDWLLNNKAWEGFAEFFDVEDAESVVRNALLAFATMAWIGAGIAYLMRVTLVCKLQDCPLCPPPTTCK
ncbi:induced myeloid leukemia cell differentiation protein Mcl-1-like [Arapaima gigas]